MVPNYSIPISSFVQFDNSRVGSWKKSPTWLWGINHLNGKTGIAAWKINIWFNGLHHSICKVSENMDCDLRRWNFFHSFKSVHLIRIIFTSRSPTMSNLTVYVYARLDLLWNFILSFIFQATPENNVRRIWQKLLTAFFQNLIQL